MYAVLHRRFLSSRVLHSLGGPDPPPLGKGRRALLLARRRNGWYLLGYHHHGEKPDQVDPDRRRTLPADQHHPVLHGIEHVSTAPLAPCQHASGLSGPRLSAVSFSYSGLTVPRMRISDDLLKC